MTCFTAPSDVTIGQPVKISRSQSTRVLHLLLLLIVTHQLINSQFIERPRPGEAPNLTYTLHEYVGLTSVGVMAAFWIWTLIRRGETQFGRLLPWFSAGRLGDVVADLIAQGRRLLRLQAPSDEDGALASAVHGLGLLVLTGMALSGAAYYLTLGDSVAQTFLAIHKIVANLMWAYLLFHAGIAMLHRLLGSDILSRMFWPMGPSL